MGNNLPVTNVERFFAAHESPTSETDEHGNILYVNHDFINISGFSEDELIGAPQNIVRHPDMPPEAFEDLWRTIKAGKAWKGLVKNRCKNGDHYWVQANVAPVVQDGRIVGYTSVRLKPSRDDVNSAEEAYRSIRSGDRSIRIVEGKVVKRSGMPDVYKIVTLKSLITAAVISMAIMFAIVAALAPDTASGKWLMGIGVFGVTMAGVFGFLIHRLVMLPLEKTRKEIERISAWDLTSNEEVRGLADVVAPLESMRVLRTNLRWLIGQIREVSSNVSKDTEEIASGSFELSSRAESQASSLEETASAMEELTGTVKQNAEGAVRAEKLVINSADIAGQSRDVVSQVVNTMSSIQESSKKISEIVSVIDGIAFQTTILALNAAIEAARAGESGRGFAVVAAEVRNLALRSSTAAKEIKDLIEDSATRVESGGKLAHEAGESMDDVVTSFELVKEIVSEISNASREQSSGIEQVNMAVAQMDTITQQNASMASENAALVNDLKNQSASLTKIMSRFRTGGTARVRVPA